MGSQFLKKNKKKGLLATLLLFFQRGRGIGPLLILIGLLSFVFMAPGSVLSRFPFASELLASLGLRSNLGHGDGMFLQEQLANALRAARARRQLRSGGGFFGRDAAGAGRHGGSSTDLIRGGKDIRGDGDQYYDGVGKGSGESVDGVLRPEDAAKMEEGVGLSEGEMQEGMLKNAMAKHFGEGGIEDIGAMDDRGRLRMLESLGTGQGIGAGSGARAAGAGDGMMKNALDKKRVPDAGGRSLSANPGGKLGWKRFQKISSRMNKALGTPQNSGRNTAMFQLAEGRAYSIAAAPPPGNCDPGTCPAEFASTASGAVFDGTRLDGEIMSAPEFGDPGVNVPSQGDIDSLLDEARKMEEDAKKCEQAEETYGAQERHHMKEVQRLSDEMANANCGSGGCSKSKYKRCQRIGDQMRAECRQYNTVARTKADACPLMNGQFSPMDCNQ